jgi:signal transduction histidine kinase
MDLSMTDEAARLHAAYEAQLRSLNLTIEKRERELAILSEVAVRIHGEEDVDRILSIALDEILGQMGLRTAWVFMGDERERKLRLAAHRGVAQSYLDEIRTRGLTDCLCPEVFWSGHRMQARNTVQCPRMPDIVEGLGAAVAHACIPLKFEGSSRGVLNVAAEPGQQFTDEELRFLETLGHQICLAVERARHLRTERERNREARALAAINKAIGGSLDPEAVLRAVGDTARELLGADSLTILLGSDAHELKVAHVSGVASPRLREGETVDLVARGGRLTVRALAERTAFSVDDVAKDERVGASLAEDWRLTSGLILPLLARERTLGLMVVSRTVPYRWTEEDVDMAEALASQASVAIENARLYKELRHAYDDLKAAQARIIQSEKMAVLGTFASGLAHEVRNPLNSMGLQLSLLERRATEAEGRSSKGVRDKITIIREEIRRLDSLVNDFLLLSRTNRVSLRPVNVDDLADELLRLLEPEATAAGVQLRRASIGEPPPEIAADPEKIKQVILNLLRNAMEAMPNGGAARIETGLIDGRVCLRIADTGPGLPDDVDVFQVFVSTKAGGTGLGLSIALQIVQDHGGEIVTESRPGEGTVFTIWLPVVAVPPSVAVLERKS